MPVVHVQIVRFTDAAFPGWVACVLRDASGRAWEFVEKAPIVTTASLDEFSVYPQPGVIACEVVGQRTDELGRTLCTIDTEHPWHVAATSGETRFEVRADQVSIAATNSGWRRANTPSVILRRSRRTSHQGTRPALVTRPTKSGRDAGTTGGGPSAAPQDDRK